MTPSPWVENAVALMNEFAAGQSDTFTIKDARQWMGDRCPPAKQHAWVAVAKEAVARGIINPCGRAAQLPGSRGSRLCYRRGWWRPQ